MTDDDTLRTKAVARENPDAVRAFAAKCDNPLKSKLLAIVEEVEE